jgi:hypothetical protein
MRWNQRMVPPLLVLLRNRPCWWWSSGRTPARFADRGTDACELGKDDEGREFAILPKLQRGRCCHASRCTARPSTLPSENTAQMRPCPFLPIPMCSAKLAASPSPTRARTRGSFRPYRALTV